MKRMPKTDDRYAPPRNDPPVSAQVHKLRRRGWSIYGISRHLGIPVDRVISIIECMDAWSGSN